jgi:hypothetical protein
MDNQSFLKHLETLAELALGAREVGELESFLDACQMILQTSNRKLTTFSLDAKSLN